MRAREISISIVWILSIRFAILRKKFAASLQRSGRTGSLSRITWLMSTFGEKLYNEQERQKSVGNLTCNEYFSLTKGLSQVWER
jgi:hypothetical protein